MSAESDMLITEVAKHEYRQLTEAVVRAAKAWHYANHGTLAVRALDDAVVVLNTFEDRHRKRIEQWQNSQ